MNRGKAVKKIGNSGNEEDRELWRQVTRTVRAYPSGKAALKDPPVRRRKLPDREITPPPMPSRPAVKVAAPKGFDKSTETKLKKGKLALEGKLDLHGMTQDEAWRALHKFVLRAVAAEKRTLLIITGKGARSEGVLKRMLPLWLEDSDLAPYVLALSPAQPKDGGSGAFYLRLRKSK
jgi:DNA-nicking Smr family endonuclease